MWRNSDNDYNINTKRTRYVVKKLKAYGLKGGPRLQIGSFFMINLCLVVIATQFSETKKREMERMRLERARYHSTSTLASSTNTSEPTTCYAEIVKWVPVIVERLPRMLFARVGSLLVHSFRGRFAGARALRWMTIRCLFSDTSAIFGDGVNEDWWRDIACGCTGGSRNGSRIYLRSSRVKSLVRTSPLSDRIVYQAVSIFK